MFGSVHRAGLQEWLRKLNHRDGVAARQVAGETTLETLKQRMAAGLSGHVIGMSNQDMRVYLRVLSAADLAALRELRFDYFDLLCRQQGEAVAMRRLREIDQLLH